jgi:uncharacterized membrane protein
MKALRTVLGLVFIAAGILHFVRPRLYEQIMPERLPMHKESVLVSGIAEVVGGAALLHGRTARFGFWWLTALLIAVFPANVHMATDPQKVPFLRKSGIPRWLLWARLPLQPAVIALLALVTRPA